MPRVPYPMTANPCHITYILVLGCREEFMANEARRRLIRAKERDDFTILSYGSLLEGLHAKGEFYVGIRHNDHVELISSNFAGESLFCWMQPEQLRIRKAPRDNVEAHRNEWRTLNLGGGGYVLDQVLPRIKQVD